MEKPEKLTLFKLPLKNKQTKTENQVLEPTI